MLGLPESTEIKKPIHKKVIYSKFESELNSERKKSFDADISRMVIMNEISPLSLNIKEGNEIESFFVVLVNIKNDKINEKNLLLISKLFGQRLLLVLEYEGKEKIVIYQTKMLQTNWIDKGSFRIELNGLDLDKVWQNIVVQVSGIEVQKGKTLDEQIEIEEISEKVLKQIEVLEKQARNEKQPKKKFELFQKINKYKQKMEEL